MTDRTAERIVDCAHALLIASLAWGALTFGAVRPWGFWPLAAAAVIVAVSGLTARTGTTPPLGLGGLAAAFALFATLCALQLVPLELETLRAVSPNTIELLNQFDPLVSRGMVKRHPLSVAPALTARGLALFVSFAMLILGSTRLLSIRGARGTAAALTAVGVVLAMAGIIHLNGRNWGSWQPNPNVSLIGPFVNKNHFAGWMLMALPVTLGLLSAGLARGFRGVKPTWRDRLLWFSSRDASGLILVAAAAVVMAIALVLTMSRSGISAVAVAIAITSAVMLRRQRTAGQRLIGIAFIALLVTLVVVSIGAGTIASHFASADWGQLNNRRGAWADAVSVFRAFPVTGAGLDMYRVTMLFYQRHDLDWHYREAHNDYLQLAAEGGVLLIVPALICAGLFIATVRRRFRDESGTTAYWLRVGAVTGLTAIALQEAVDFSLQMPGNAALFAVLCGIALHRPSEHRRAAVSVR